MTNEPEFSNASLLERLRNVEEESAEILAALERLADEDREIVREKISNI